VDPNEKGREGRVRVIKEGGIGREGTRHPSFANRSLPLLIFIDE